MTRARKRSAAAATVASCSSCLEPKWAKRPLLLIRSSAARRPIVSPSRPSTDATSTARSRIDARVSEPFWVTGVTDVGYKKARTFVKSAGQAGGEREEEMGEYAVKKIDDMEAVYLGAFKRARAELGVESFGLQVIDLPPDFE